MRILLAQNMFYVPSYGGANKSNRVVLEELAARGYHCMAIARAIGTQGPASTRKFLEELELAQIQCSHSSSGLYKFWHNNVEVHALIDVLQLRDHLSQTIRDFSPDWILVSSEDPGQTFLQAALEAKPNRVIYFAHTPQFFPFGPSSFYQNKLGADLVKRTASIIAIGKRTASYVKEYTDIDPKILHPPVYGPPPFPNYGNFDNGAVTIINPSAVKGISIFRELSEAFPDHPFAALIGWSTTPGEVDLLSRLKNVRLIHPIQNMEEIYRNIRILIVPSLYQEGFGLTVVEAMLRGIPVMASDYGGLSESKLGVDYSIPILPIEEYQNRLDSNDYPVPIIPNQNIQPWINALHSLLTDRIHYEQLSRDSHQAAVNFVSSISIEPFVNYLENLAPAHTRKSKETLPSLEIADQKDQGIERRINNLSPNKRALLALRLKEKRAKAKQRGFANYGKGTE